VARYAAEVQLPKGRHPLLLLAVNDLLIRETRASKALFPDARLVELPDVRGIFVLDSDTDRFAMPARDFFT
jgi:hypothetical protein